jgi:hypothetical protein
MEGTGQRRVPLVVVAGRQGTAALVECLRAQGAIVYQTRTPAGCLRVATSVRPDIILLSRGFPRRVALLLRQHPTSAAAKIVWLRRPTATGDVLADHGLARVDESVVTEGRPPRPAAVRQASGQDLQRLARHLAGECLQGAESPA